MRPAQRGASGLFVAIILLLVAAGALAILALSRGTAQIERGTQVSDRFKLLQNALQQYVAANGRLPCPANPTLDTGEENPAVPGAVCLSPGQAVPWKVIGVRMEDTIDPWGGKITYFVYTGGAGSLTQAGGASMVDCDLDEPPPLKGTVTAIDLDGPFVRIAQGSREGERFEIQRIAAEKTEMPEAKPKKGSRKKKPD